MPTRPHRFAIAGFQHESNSFGAGQAGLAEFEMADSWPGLLQGAEVISGTLGINLPIAGFVQEAQAAELVPILWCAAEPSAPVTAAAFDEISQRILDGIASAGALDGLYLDLHGAMITELHDDGEGELLRRIRGLVGPNLPIVISLDMHANVTGAMVAQSDAICMFRTYPHLDMAATGARCANVLVNMAQTGGKPAKAFRTLPFLIPLHAQDTNAAPAREIYAHVQAATDPPHSWVEFAVGFTAGDSPHTGPSVLAYGPDQAVADASAEDLHDRVLAAEASFAKPLLSPDEAVRAAMQAPKGRPVVIAEVQDNAGGGSGSDGVELLRALVDHSARGAMFGVLHDPAAARTAHQIGRNGRFQAALGGHSGGSGAPFPVEVEVVELSGGQVRYEGQMYGGGVAEIGPSACLRIDEGGCDIQVVVSSIRNQCLDRGYFRHVGLVPETARIIVVKSTVHFREEFEPIAQDILACSAPGSLSCVLSDVAYTKLRAGLRMGPNGPRFAH